MGFGIEDKFIKKTFLNKLFYLFFYVSQNCYRRETYNQFYLKYNIDPSFRLNGEGITFYGDGVIKCGKNSYIGGYSSIQAYKNCKVVIGNNCSIGRFVKIFTCNAVADQDFSKELKYSKGDVIIGDNCWIGIGVFIKEGVKVGSNVVIGANSAVVKDVPSDSVAAGAPAKIIKFKSYLSNLEKEKLADKYWDSLSDKLKIEFKRLRNNKNPGLWS
ncbi:MAG: acyltransferase, partial [Candidatus Staskawiczbacteria bacterium]